MGLGLEPRHPRAPALIGANRVEITWGVPGALGAGQAQALTYRVGDLDQIFLLSGSQFLHRNRILCF